MIPMPPAGQINNCCDSLKDKETFRTGKWEIKPGKNKISKGIRVQSIICLVISSLRFKMAFCCWLYVKLALFQINNDYLPMIIFLLNLLQLQKRHSSDKAFL